MLNYYYKDSISTFLEKSINEIFGAIERSNQFDSRITQRGAWEKQIEILKEALVGFDGTIFFEFIIPRMGKRVDCILIIKNVVFVIEFKVGESAYLTSYVDQVWDYALDLKYFHKPSEFIYLAPILISTEAPSSFLEIRTTHHADNLLSPLKSNKKDLKNGIKSVLSFCNNTSIVDANDFANGSYAPTPTIIQAAMSLYSNHSVHEITRSDASAKNLTDTSAAISGLINYAKSNNKKIICFVTGVPGAGKTLVGLKVAAENIDKSEGDRSVYLSGNGPLVAILQEALARDEVSRKKALGLATTKKQSKAAVKTFIQNIHHYRDEYIRDTKAPHDHVAIFDEAQRAWDKKQTVDFMRTKKNISNFDFSEPEFLISCLDRHKDWAVVICLVGGGQEINKGEAGISEWLDAIGNKFPKWQVNVSSNLLDSEYNADKSIANLNKLVTINYNPNLHLSVCLRSYRAEKVSHFIKALLEFEQSTSTELLSSISINYPMVLTRDLAKAKKWLKEKARGSERYGIVVSSKAQRLKPFAIDVKSPMDPVNWFLNDKDNVNSSYYLEDVATEFHVQGLELDWACVAWDGDLRYSENGWQTFSFKGNGWQNIHKEDRKQYLINAYRVLLTRARQGMIILVPEGSDEDHTRKPEYYDGTFNYLKGLGMQII